MHIITGSNGAGKSSVGTDFLPPHIKNFYLVFDGDKLAGQKRKELQLTKKYGYKESKAIADDWVSKQFMESVERSIKGNDHFAYEGHFREEKSWSVIRRFKDAGYKIHMIFFGLKSTDLSELRVRERAINGGHNVSAAEIDLNFRGNLIQLDKHLELLDELRIFDTSELEPVMLGHLVDNTCIYQRNLNDQYEWFTDYLINLSRKIYPNI